MIPILQIGPLSLQFPPLIFIFGIWVSLSVVEKIHQRKNIDFSSTYNLILSLFAGALLGARLIYVLSYPSFFIKSPISIISPALSLFDPWGALAGAVITYFIFARIRHFSLSLYVDSIALFLSFLSVFISIADFASGGTLGQPTQAPWGINYLGASRHPVQVYEAIGFVIISLILSRRFLSPIAKFNGYLALEFLFLSSMLKFIVYGFVMNQTTIIGGVRFEQLVYFIISIIFFYLITRFS